MFKRRGPYIDVSQAVIPQRVAFSNPLMEPVGTVVDFVQICRNEKAQINTVHKDFALMAIHVDIQFMIFILGDSNGAQ